MSYIGRGLQSGAFRQLDDISSGFDGSDTTHTMQVNSTNVTVGDVNQILLSLGGVIQKPGTDFTVSSSTLTFTTAPAANTSFFAILLGSDNGGTVTPTDGSVTSDKLAYPFVVNEDGAAASDFRVESDSKTHMLFVDAGNNAICVGTDTHDTGPLVVQTGNTHATAMTIQSTGHTQLMLKDTDASSNDKYWGLQVSGGAFNILTMDDDKASNFVTPLTIDSTGAVTKPAQPAVLAYSSSAQNDIATGVVTIQLDAEVYDVNADFNTSNYTFTAPVTGKYMCSGQIVMTDVDTAFQWIYGRFNTSNRIYYMALIDPRIEITQDGGHTWTFSALVDMDANDTLVLDTRSSAHGAAQNNITLGTATSLETFMTVYLAV
jgi:hypothetical protein